MAFCRRSSRFPYDQTSGWQITIVTFIWRIARPKVFVQDRGLARLSRAACGGPNRKWGWRQAPVSAEHEGVAVQLAAVFASAAKEIEAG